MDQNQVLLDYAARIDAATNEVAADLKSLRDQLATEGISAETLTVLDAAAAKLETTGKDPETPEEEA